MELQVGKTYRFKDKVDLFTIVLMIDEEHPSYYKCDVLYAKNIGYDEGQVMLVYKNSNLMRKYNIEEVVYTDAGDNPTGKGLRFNYKDPELRDLFIDMALQTKDKKWFKKIMSYQLEVTACEQ